VTLPLAPSPTQAGFANSLGVRIAWHRYGAGARVVLFIPTWNIVDARVVGQQVAFLAERMTVLTYDPRGAGESERPASGYTFEHHLADALAVLDANAVRRASIITASRGMSTAVLMAARNPDRVERLAAVGAYMRLVPEPPNDDFWKEPDGDEEPGRWTAASWRRDWPGFARWFMELVFTEPDSSGTIDWVTAVALGASPEVLIAQASEADFDPPARALAQIRCPTLLIHGSADSSAPVELARQIAAQIPNARLEIIEGGGHRPDIRSPERVNPVLADFLEVDVGR
jgi:pimeloyl-ACP methyl ester carboxylesterase